MIQAKALQMGSIYPHENDANLILLSKTIFLQFILYIPAMLFIPY